MVAHFNNVIVKVNGDGTVVMYNSPNEPAAEIRDPVLFRMTVTRVPG